MPREILEASPLQWGSPYSEMEAFFWLVSKAPWEGERRGCIEISERKMAAALDWSRSKVTRYLDKLAHYQLANHIRTKNRTTIQIINFSSYQGGLNQNDSSARADTRTKSEGDTTSYKRNKKKKDPSDPIPDGNLTVQQVMSLPLPPKWGPRATRALEDWATYRKARKFPTVRQTWEKTIADYADNPQRFVAAVDFTIGKGWQGLADDPNSSLAPQGQKGFVNRKRNAEDVMDEAKELYKKMFNKDLGDPSEERGDISAINVDFSVVSREESH